ncbi:uncharacterized protein [Amphiura filiformis]|uniref:uncharacterized protein n=1 Tax=Amphiura filiformis TaxID=82378 RepID=UPI003B21D9DF
MAAKDNVMDSLTDQFSEVTIDITEKHKKILQDFLVTGKYSRRLIRGKQKFHWPNTVHLLLNITEDGVSIYTEMFDSKSCRSHCEQTLYKTRDIIQERIKGKSGIEVNIYLSYSPCNTFKDVGCADMLLKLSEDLGTDLNVFFPQLYNTEHNDYVSKQVASINKAGLKKLHDSRTVKCDILEDWEAFYKSFMACIDIHPSPNQDYLQKLVEMLPKSADVKEVLDGKTQHVQAQKQDLAKIKLGQ